MLTSPPFPAVPHFLRFSTSWIAGALILLGSSPVLASGGMLSFELRSNNINADTTEVRQSNVAQGPMGEPSIALISDNPGLDSLSLRLLKPSEPAIVASAPLSLSHVIAGSVEQVGLDLARSSTSPVSSQTNHLRQSTPIPEPWWNQGANSPIAVAIGNAEGTRQVNGSKTTAYYWHRDPGNGADNFGTFSYQHFPRSLTRIVRQQVTPQSKREASAQAQLPERADQAQMKRLRGFHEELQAQARAHNLKLSQMEIMNGLDLANQSEAAALSMQGYIDRLAQMKGLTHDQEEQILEARTWSYWEPERRRWNAPGLGNTYSNIRRDQARRHDAIRLAMETYQSTYRRPLP